MPQTPPNIEDDSELTPELAASYLNKTKSVSNVSAATGIATEPVKRPAPPRPKNGVGCRPRCSCTGCGCLILISCLAVVALSIFTITQRPPAIWEPVKTILNSGSSPRTLGDGKIDPDPILQKAQKEFEAKKTITLTESELAVLLSNKLNMPVGVTLLPGKAQIFINLENNKGGPLWAIFELTKTDQKQLKVARVGTGAVSVPESLTESVVTTIQSFIAQGQGQINDLINSGAIKLDDINFNDGQIIIHASINLNLDNFGSFL